MDDTLSLLSMEWLRGTLDCGGTSTLVAAASSWSLSKPLISCGSAGVDILRPGIREERPHLPAGVSSDCLSDVAINGCFDCRSDDVSPFESV